MRGIVGMGLWLGTLLAFVPRLSADPPALEITVLERVDLPWQSPEVILTAVDTVPGPVEVTVERPGAPVVTESLPGLTAGEARSVTFFLPEGKHPCVITVAAAGERWVREVAVAVVPELQLQFGEADVDLAARRLSFGASRPPSFAELSVYDVDGALIHQASTEFGGRRPQKRYRVSWPALSHHAARVELRVFTHDDAWADASWTPIDVEVQHEPIYFEPGPGGTVLADASQLDAAHRAAIEEVARHRGVRGLTLYVLAEGHGSDPKQAEQDAAKVARALTRRGKLGVPVKAGRLPSPQGDGPPAALVPTRVRTILSTRAPASAEFAPVAR